MASATGIPQNIPDTNGHSPEGYAEDEPLLGRRGDASQEEGKPLYHNLYLGTAVVAQAGILLLVASVWANVFLNDLILFSAHPLLNSAGLLALTQGILILQPTHTPQQKRQGTIAHFTINNIAIDALIAGLVVIEYNKIAHNGTHFVSAHAILGLITYILLAIQALVGFTAYFFPQLYGSVDNAKSLYKYHRISGYVILTTMLATVCAATQTDYNKNVLDIKLWAVLVSSILLLIGVLPRIKKQKLGITGPKPSGAFGQ
ncbi:hypothetical protein GLAREA_00462 [Glarea lozoyensis ATCC 20868]|uniref:Cytochrome b561 domain-containing protein n=1 Tax=Glarea lozoyensis (strain ATCC 20868 / MF5171) TaxID=1116229 RepID=S3CSB5_GLAL2|nr:uncharacterized protein GLAREA_00462 [Glarea lozoyensis ATCC 20868]EPE29302.1 hypothetical protein GLAREA_00462 [Glarea lozoyensis ATCC 20868]